MVPGLFPVVINPITRHRSILGVREDRAQCCQVLRLAGLSLFGHRAWAVFGFFWSRASAISPVASPLGGCGTVCTSVFKERCSPSPVRLRGGTSPAYGDAQTSSCGSVGVLLRRKRRGKRIITTVIGLVNNVGYWSSRNNSPSVDGLPSKNCFVT